MIASLNRYNLNLTLAYFLLVFLPLIGTLLFFMAPTSTAKVIICIAFISGIFVLIAPEIYFILFLILRPLMDLLSGKQIIGNINSASIATIIFILLGSLILFRKDNIKKIKENKYIFNANKIFLLFLLISMLSNINTKDFVISFTNWLRFAAVLVVFNYSYVYFSDKKTFKILFLIVLISAFLPVSMGFCQYVLKTGNRFTPGFNRVYGTFVHPNVFAQYLAVIFLAILYFLKTTSKIKITLKIGLWLALIVIGFELFQTYTRGAWIALSVSLILFGLSYKKAKKLIVYLLMFIILLALFPTIQQRFMDLRHPRPNQLSSWQWRLMIWNDTKKEIKNQLLIGHGLGMYEETFSYMAHNDYLRLGYEIGVLGLTFYLIYLFYILFISTKLALKAKDNSEGSRYTTIICLIVILLIISTADNLARSAVILIYLFCLIGALFDTRSEKQSI